VCPLPIVQTANLHIRFEPLGGFETSFGKGICPLGLYFVSFSAALWASSFAFSFFASVVSLLVHLSLRPPTVDVFFEHQRMLIRAFATALKAEKCIPQRTNYWRMFEVPKAETIERRKFVELFVSPPNGVRFHPIVQRQPTDQFSEVFDEISVVIQFANPKSSSTKGAAFLNLRLQSI
jgi:hypothetical protein